MVATLKGKRKMAKNTVAKAQTRAATKGATAPQTPAPVTMSDEQRAQLAELRKVEREASVAASKAFDGKVVKITGGKKRKDQSGNVLWAGPNRFGARILRIEFSDGIDYVDQKHAEIVGDMDKATKSRVEATAKAEREETFYIAASIGVQKDKSVRMDYRGWVKSIWFSHEMICKTGVTDGTEANLMIFEIPAWKVRKECGGDAYDALAAKQAALEAI